MRAQCSVWTTLAVAGATMIASVAATLALQPPDRSLAAAAPNSPGLTTPAATPLRRPAVEPLLIPTPRESEPTIRTALADESDLLPPEPDPLELPDLPVGFPADPIPAQPAPVPAPLPSPGDAAPLDRGHNPSRDEAILELLRREFPNATADEQHVWLEELRSLPLDDIPQLLQLRRSLGGPQRRARPEAPNDFGLPAMQPPELVPDHAPVPECRRETAERARSTCLALEQACDVVLNNIANASTPGFKRSRVVLSELPYQQLEAVDAGDPDAHSLLPFAVGLGVGLAATELDQSPGRLEETGRPLDLTIRGDGFFRVSGDGETLYTRAGHFGRGADGELVLIRSDGPAAVEPPVTIPAEATRISVAEDGTVTAATADSAKPVALGQLQLARFPNAEALTPCGGGLFTAGDAAGTPIIGMPGANGLGTIAAGALESSNVRLKRELAEWRRLQAQIAALREIAGPDAAPPATRDEWWAKYFLSPKAGATEQQFDVEFVE